MKKKMKKTILLLVAVFVSFLAMAQEKTEMRLDLKNGTSLTGQVQIQSDGSYLIEMPSGDVFFFSQAEVRKAVAIGSIGSQEVPKDYYDRIVEKKKGKIYKLSTGEELVPGDFATYSGWEKYRKAQNAVRTSNILLIATGGMVAVGGSMLGVYLTADVDEGWGIAAGLIGMAAIPVGITSLIFGISGNKKLIKIQDAYNYNQGYVLDFGAQQYGVGFALKF